MLVVYKYPVAILNKFDLQLPRGARILTAQVQRGDAQLWALVDSDKPTERREFLLTDTGQLIAQSEENLVYIGTYQLHDGVYVGHLFEVLLSDGARMIELNPAQAQQVVEAAIELCGAGVLGMSGHPLADTDVAAIRLFDLLDDFGISEAVAAQAFLASVGRRVAIIKEDER